MSKNKTQKTSMESGLITPTDGYSVFIKTLGSENPDIMCVVDPVLGQKLQQMLIEAVEEPLPERLTLMDLYKNLYSFSTEGCTFLITPPPAPVLH